MTQRQKRWIARSAKAVVVAVLLGAALLLAGKWWIAPAAIRYELRRRLPDYWLGTAEIGRIDFSYTGPISLRDVVFRDRRGRTWLRVAEVALTLEDWPSLHPRVCSLAVGAPHVTAHVDDGRCVPPWRKIPSDLWLEYLALRVVHVRAGVVEVRENGRPAMRRGALWADAYWDPLARSLHLNLPWRQGLVLADVRVEGFVLADDRIEVGRLVAKAAGGKVFASLRSRLAGDGLWRTEGQAAAMNVDLQQLRLPLAGAEKGLLTGIVHFRQDDWDANGLTGRGAGYVKNADLRNMPPAVALLRHAGLGRPEMIRQADLDAQFEFRGTVATVGQARVSLPLAAVDVEAGSTMDIWTGEVDFLAVVVLFERVRGLLKSIPLVGLMVDLTERFSRFRVRGRWQDPDSLAVAPASLKDVQDATRRFLAAAATGRGSIGKTVRNGLRTIFAPADPNAPNAPPDANAPPPPTTAPASSPATK